MVQNGEPAKQIWITEFGYCSNRLPPPGYEYCKYMTEEQQARSWSRPTSSPARLPYVGGHVQWNLNFQLDVPQADEKWGFGIVRADYSGRPAYFSLLGMPKP